MDDTLKPANSRPAPANPAATHEGGDCCHAPAAGPAPEERGHDCCHAPSAATAGPASAGHCSDRSPAAPGAYFCPMCPDVTSEVPAACPKCGMALEASVMTASRQPDAELADMRRRLRIALALTVPLVAYAMAGMAGLLPPWISGPLLPWVQFALATPVVLWCGWPLLVRAWRSLASRRLNMFTLIGLGVGVAWGSSVFATIAPGLVPDSFVHGGHVALYYESAAMIVTLVLLGQVLEIRARQRTGAALSALLDLAPKQALRIGADDVEQRIPLQDVRPGDRLRVRPGDAIPVDGSVIEGHAAVDESMVTGESLPVDKAPGDTVVAGSLNGMTSFVMGAERVGAETLLARIVQAVAEAQRSRAPVQALADRVSAWFVPAVIAVALLAAAAWWLLGPEPRLAYAVAVAVSTLIIACPCALGLATPMSMTVAMGRGARTGVLLRNAAALERLRDVDTIVLDKTGTLTKGRPEVVSVIPVEDVAESELLRFAASLEQASEHPIAAAVVAAAEARGLRLGRSYGFSAMAGMGATGVVQMRRVAVGNRALLEAAGIDVVSLETDAERLRTLGQTVIYVALDGEPVGLLGVADPLKPEAWEVVQQLKAEGIDVVILSGDHEQSVRAIAEQLGVVEVHAAVLPEEKAGRIRELQRAGRTVAMAGDGVNDAPALAAADVGIAMGAGSDVARQSAGVTLVSGDLRGIPRALRLSEATMRNVGQNLLFAFGYNALGVPLAAGVLYPFTGLLLTPAVAAAAMSFSSVSVIGNALRLRSVRI